MFSMGGYGLVDQICSFYFRQVYILGGGLYKDLIYEIAYRHRIILSIKFYRGEQFTFRFWRSFKKSLGTKVNVFHLQMDGQVELTIHTLEAMIRVCIIDFLGNWNKHLTLVWFS